MLSKVFLPTLLFVLTLGFGYWISRLGRPYHGLLFNLHKLIALGAAVLTIVRLVDTFEESGSPLIPILLAILAAVCVLVLFVSGALLSAGKLDYLLLRATHRIAMILLPISLGLAAYFLARM